MSKQVDEMALAKKIEAALAAVQVGQYSAFDAWMLVVPDLTALFNELRGLRAAADLPVPEETQ